VTKVKSILRYTQKEKLELLENRLEIRNNQKGLKTSNLLIELQSAITNYQVVHIDYLSLDGRKSQRDVEPFALFSTNENWVLVAYCQLRDGFRAFRLDCIQKMVQKGKKFGPHNITLSEYFDQCREKRSTPDTPLSQGHSNLAVHRNSNKMEKVEIGPFELIGIAVRTTNENNLAAKEIAGLWGKFMSENVLDSIPNKIDSTVYSLYTEYEGDHMQPYTAILGCKVENLDTIPEGMTGMSFNGGSYVKTTAQGDLMKGLIVNEWSKIWEMELDRAFTADFEVFGPEAQDPSNAKVDFFISVK